MKDEAKHLTLYDYERVTLTEQRIVRVTSLNDILYKSNFYALPLGRYNDGDRVRIEEKWWDAIYL